MIQEMFKMKNKYAVEIPTLPVNQCLTHLIQFLVECQAVLWECRAAKMGRQESGTHMVHRETFLQIQQRLLLHLIRRSWSMEFSFIRTHITTCDEWEPNSSSGSELPVRTVSQKFIHPWWGTRMPDIEVLDAKIASALNRIIHNSHFKRRVSLEEQKSPKRGPFPPRKTDRFPDLRVLPGHWRQWFRRGLCRPIYKCSSKWWYSGSRFDMGRKFIINDENPTWWHLGRIVQTKNTRVWETQDRIGNCTKWRFIRSKQDLIITDSRQWWKEVSSKIYEFWGQKR